MRFTYHDVFTNGHKITRTRSQQFIIKINKYNNYLLMPPSYIRKDSLELNERDETLHRFFDGYEGILYQQVILYTKQGPERQWRKLYGVVDNNNRSFQIFTASPLSESTNIDPRSQSPDTVVPLKTIDSFDALESESDSLKLRSRYNRCIGEFFMDEETLIYDIAGNIDGKTNLFYFSQPHLIKDLNSDRVEPADPSSKSLRKVGDIIVDDDFFYLSSPSVESKTAWLEALTDSCHNGFKVIHQPEIFISGLKNDSTDSLFYPTVDLIVDYGDIRVENGNIFKPSTAEVAPTISYRAHSLSDKDKYSLLMLDIDPIQQVLKGSRSNSHDSQNGSKKAYLHWCIMSINGADITSGNQIVPYESPAPPIQSGLHRYFFLLFKHPKKFITAQKLFTTMQLCSRRENFPYEEWAKSMGFGDPVGVNGFYSGWEELYCDRIHDSLCYIPPEEYRSPKQKAEIISSDRQLEIEYSKAELYKNLNLGDILPSISNWNGRNSSDLFPSVALSIRYAPTADNQDCIDFDVNGGNILTATTALHVPTVTYNCRKNGLAPYFTLVLTDPDVPSRVKPSMRESIHWVVMNIPSNRVDEGVVVLPYVGAAAPYGSGLHRYVYLLYQQTAVLSPEHLAISIEHLKPRRGLHIHSFLTTLRDNMGNSLLMNIPVGMDAFLSEWEPLVDEIHRSMDWVPPMAFLSPGQTLLAVHKHIEAEESNKLTLLNSTGDGANLVSANSIDRNRNHRPYKRVQLSTSMDSGASAGKSPKQEKSSLKDISPSEDSAESRLAAFYKSGLTNSSESCGSELQKSNSFLAAATIPVSDGTEPSSSLEVDEERSPSLHLYKKSFNDIAAAANSAEDLCQIFAIASPAIFRGDRFRKKFSSDYLFKDSFIWVDPVKKSLHWSKIGSGKSTPEQSKYLSFVRRTSPNLSGSKVRSSGSRSSSPVAKVSDPRPLGDPQNNLPLGEAKGVVSSVDPIAGGVAITTESGEHLDIKILQPAVLVDMIKVLKELTASMRYFNNSDKPVL